MRNWMIAAMMTGVIVSTSLAAPTTQPATDETARQSDAPIPMRILVLPIAETGGSSHPWLARAFQQDLMSELSGTTKAQIEAPSAVQAISTSSAIEAGHSANAGLVVYGNFQILGNDAIITGQILNVQTRESAGTFSASGQMANLFPVEDSVANQILRALPSEWLLVSVAPLAEGAPPATQPIMAVAVPPAPAMQYYSYTYPDYSAGPGYAYGSGAEPYYWYSVPFYGPDIWFFGEWDFYHHHYWDHGWNGHAGDHGISHGFSHSPSSHSGHSGGGGGGGHASGASSGGGHGR